MGAEVKKRKFLLGNKKLIKNLNSAIAQETIPSPGENSSGVILCPELLAETLTHLNNIFDKHHRKYGNRILWRKAIIENLAAWKLGLDN